MASILSDSLDGETVIQSKN